MLPKFLALLLLVLVVIVQKTSVHAQRSSVSVLLPEKRALDDPATLPVPNPDEDAWEVDEIARCGCVGCCPLRRTTVTTTSTITSFDDCLVTSTLSILYTTLQLETTTTASVETTTSTLTFTITTTFIRYQEITSMRTKTATSVRTFTLSTNLSATWAVGTDTTSATSIFTAFYSSATTVVNFTVTRSTQVIITQSTLFTGASVSSETVLVTIVVTAIDTILTDTTITAYSQSDVSLDAYTFTLTDPITSTISELWVSRVSFTSSQPTTPTSYVETLGWNLATLTLTTTTYYPTGPETETVEFGTTTYTFSLIPPA